MNYHLNEHKTGYSNLLIAIFLTILTVVTRVPFVSKYLFEWDSVNFALSFNKYDIAMQQPQSPGYILYVYLGKVVNSIFHDPNTTMVFISIIFSILTVLLVYFLAKQMLSQKIAIISTLLLIFSPIFWFYGEIATIYPVESFLAVLIVYTSYQILRGKTRFIYISALTLGIAGGFRQELIIFMLPLWLYCLHHHFKDIRRLSTSFIIFIVSIMLWAVPTVLFAGGLKSYMVSSGHFAASFKTTSAFFGAAPTTHILMDTALLSWLILGVGFVTAIILVFFLLKKWKTILNFEMVKNPIFMILLLWILPELLFQIFIPLSKPGYILTYLPALLIIAGYAFNFLSSDLSRKFSVSPKSILGCLLIITIILNGVYFLYPYHFNSEETWETPVSQMNESQKIELGIDMLAMYNYEKIYKNDKNTEMHIQTILELSNSDPGSTMVVVRDITREDQGFSWRKSSYYLPASDNYYFLDYENSQFKSAKMTSNVSVFYEKNDQISGFENETVVIPVNSSIKRIVWIMSDKSEFFKEVQSKIGLKVINLPNGLKIYYSDINGTDMNVKINNFIFKTSQT
ncbi:glycosyltransferase family 39 protein [Methanobacterium paludis]|uniref:Glycosyl transferase family 39 n=1 Tax=Methanobacterium paludis (strain DSM 25820 / JCM 18151 / SWAN1) TaxID=868131 RepID=F6D222_METPW|nr:glycosyltransferase family 39 protein [Methanobacterium paludis]AEG17311.1 glycosyl transferase family 39 [Methanobacterium paludis]